MRAPSVALFLVLGSIPRVAFAADPAATPPGGYGVLLLKMAFVLAGVCLLAWVSLRWGLKRFVSPDRGAGGAMEVLGRLPLEPRRSLLVVRIASRHLVLSSSENGVETVAELSPEEAAVFLSDETSSRSFAEVLRSWAPDVSRETSTPEET